MMKNVPISKEKEIVDDEVFLETNGSVKQKDSNIEQHE
jgi:hypothetical protein